MRITSVRSERCESSGAAVSPISQSLGANVIGVDYYPTLATGDLNGDGKPDFVAQSPENSQLLALLGSNAPASIALSAGARLPAANGQAFTIFALLTDGSAFAAPTAPVSFSLDGGPAVTANPSNGIATFTVPADTPGGNHSLAASYAGDQSTSAANSIFSFQIQAGPQTISFGPLNDVTFGTAPFSL